MREPIQDWTPFRQAFAREFNERRTALGLTLSGLAEQSGVTMAGLSKFQNGTGLPSVKTFMRLAGVFGIEWAGEVVEAFRPLMRGAVSKSRR